MKVLHPVKFALVLLIVSSITACSSMTSGRKVDYKSAASRDTLEIPPDLTRLPSGQLGTGVTTYSGYAAEQNVTHTRSADVLPTFSKVKLERDGNERWLVVSEKADTLWPQLREFIFGVGLSIARENRATGMIETNWAENRASKGGKLGTLFGWFRDTSVRDRYRIRVEEGTQRGTTRVYLSHLGLIEVVASGGQQDIVQTVWQPRDPDPELEAEMLRLLMVFLGVEDAKARSMLTAGVGRSRASLEFDENDVAQLRTTDPFSSSWQRLGKALDRMGVEVTSKDRNKGIYAIAVTRDEDKGKKPGFFARMMGKTEIAPTPYRLKIVALKQGTEIQLLEEKKDTRVSTTAGKIFMKELHEALR
jgi:outer membrane protein assembly factor BamC